jgi:hypothetical protein
MVIDALHDIARHPDIKKRNGQIHQLDKKIGNQRNVDSGREVQ